MQNLISNALKFHKEGEAPVVNVYGELLEGRRACVVVEDNGIGLDEKYVEQIFGPFQRLHGHDSYEGTGMGLAICRRVVERHGGEITARSILGEGTKFIIALPTKHAEASSEYVTTPE